jgi:hypothetical protein
MRVSERSLEELRASIEREQGPDEPTDVWAEHWHAFAVFRAMGTQWRVRDGGDRGLLYDGLDYGGLEPVLAEHRRSMPRRRRQPLARLMPQLRTLEAAARTALNAQD